MRTTSFALAAAAGLASTAMADFAIWNTNVATAGAPGGPLKSAVFVQYLDSGIACADFESENKRKPTSPRRPPKDHMAKPIALQIVSTITPT
jgi:hypothetical protein